MDVADRLATNPAPLGVCLTRDRGLAAASALTVASCWTLRTWSPDSDLGWLPSMHQFRVRSGPKSCTSPSTRHEHAPSSWLPLRSMTRSCFTGQMIGVIEAASPRTKGRQVMPDTLDQARKAIQARLHELEDEAKHLRDALGNLDHHRLRGRRRPTTTKRSTARRAPRGQRQKQFLAAVKKKPGAPVSQIAKEMGVAPTSFTPLPVASARRARSASRARGTRSSPERTGTRGAQAVISSGGQRTKRLSTFA